MSKTNPLVVPLVVPLLVPALLLAFAAPSLADADVHWPQWRGPHGTGVAPAGDPPLEWSEERNVRFKVPVPGNGLGSPVVWGDRIYLMSAVPADEAAFAESKAAAEKKVEEREWPPSVEPVAQAFVLLALDAESGEVVWRKTLRESVPHEAHYVDSSWASGSPLVDGERVIAHFGSFGTYALDLDGELLWSCDLGDMETRNAFGEGASPALHDGKLVIPWDHEGESFVVALDAVTGEELWRTPRPGEPTSWATPAIVDVKGKTGETTQVILPGTGRSRGYDLATGEELWSLDGMTTNVIPTPPSADGRVFLASGFRGEMIQAVDLAKAAEIGSESTEIDDTDAVLWSHERHTPYVPSLLLHDGIVYYVKHYRNIVSAADAATGEIHYQTRVEPIRNMWASPVAVGDRVYFTGRAGTFVVVRSGPEYEVLAVNRLDDRFDASPAIVGDTIYVRGRQHLYALSVAPLADAVAE